MRLRIKFVPYRDGSLSLTAKDEIPYDALVALVRRLRI